jgi:two-component system LytT family sensor kinase
MKAWRARSVLLLVGLALASGTLQFLYHYLDDLSRGVNGTFATRFIEEWTGTLTFFALIPFVFELCRRMPWRRERWPQTIAVLVVAGVLFSLAHTTLMAITRSILFPLVGLGPYDYGNLVYRYPMEMANDDIFFAILVTLLYFIQRMREARERELAAAHLETQLAQARLDNLRLQSQPHFLFNALNAISAVMYEDPRAADTMIARLSDFLRATLDVADEREASLENELRIVSLYADIMRARLEHNLRLDCACPSDLRDVRVPSLVLQPLVENAIVHGMTGGRSGIGISIAARRDGDDVVIRVTDDGAGLDGARETSGGGRGLANTRMRLAQLYGDGERFRIARRSEGGTEVELRVPYRVA